MILHVKGTEFTHHLTEEILLLTGQSTLLTDSIDHDAARQTLAFTVERSPVSSARTRFWRPAAVQYDRSARRATVWQCTCRRWTRIAAGRRSR